MSSTQPFIVLVEDDPRLAELISNYLQGQGFRLAVENRGDRVVERVGRERPDLLILDLGLPGQDGFSICKALRPAFVNPILILTARANDMDQVLGLELGADDYVVKPVEPRVLLARVNALLRRRRLDGTTEARTLRFGRLVINIAARSVELDGDAIALSSNEFELLAYLAARAGAVQSRDSLYQHLLRREYDGTDRTLDVRMSHLRKKLGEPADGSERLKTIWGHGYLFVADAW